MLKKEKVSKLKTTDTTVKNNIGLNYFSLSLNKNSSIDFLGLINKFLIYVKNLFQSAIHVEFREVCIVRQFFSISD
jgi:hypothetical protein